MVNNTLRPLFLLGNTQYTFHRRIDGPQGRSGRVRKISVPPGFDPRTVQPVVSHYGDGAILAHRIQGGQLRLYRIVGQPKVGGPPACGLGKWTTIRHRQILNVLRTSERSETYIRVKVWRQQQHWSQCSGSATVAGMFLAIRHNVGQEKTNEVFQIKLYLGITQHRIQESIDTLSKYTFVDITLTGKRFWSHDSPAWCGVFVSGFYLPKQKWR